MTAIDAIASDGSVSHGMGGPPSFTSRRLIRPTSVAYSAFHRIATTAPEMTTGRKNDARQKARNAIGRLSASASASAVTIWSGRWIARKTKVFATARQKRASTASSCTLSSPAKDGSVTRSHRMNTSASAKITGYATNARMKTVYGAVIIHPERVSARIDDLLRLGRRAGQRHPHRDDAVDAGCLVGLRD